MARDVDKILEEIKAKKKQATAKAEAENIIKSETEPPKTEKNPISEGGMNALSRFMNEDEPKAEPPKEREAVTENGREETSPKKSDDYIDEKFVQFFTQQVIVTKSPEETSNVDIKKKKGGFFKRKYITDSLSLNVDKRQAENSAKSAAAASQSTGEIKRAAADNIARIMAKKRREAEKPTKESSSKKADIDKIIGEIKPSKTARYKKVDEKAEKTANAEPVRAETAPSKDELKKPLPAETAVKTAKPAEKSDNGKAAEKTEAKDIPPTDDNTVKPKTAKRADADALVREILARKRTAKPAPKNTKPAAEPAVSSGRGDIISRIYTSVTETSAPDITGYIPIDEPETDKADEKTAALRAENTDFEPKEILPGDDEDESEYREEEIKIKYFPTGEFARHTETDGDNIIEELFGFKRTLSVRMAVGVVCGIALMLYNIMGNGGWGLPKAVSPLENPIVYYIVAAVIFAVCLIVYLPTVISGFTASKKAPRSDTFVSLSAVLSMIQLLCGIAFAKSAEVEGMTIFAAYTCFGLVFNAMGKMISTDTIIKNMKLANVPDGINAGYIIEDEEAVRKLSRSLDEKLPSVLVSRKTGAISNFIESGFSVHAGEYTARKAALLSYAITLVCFGLGIIRTDSVIGGIICRAGAAALQIPLSHTLVSSVPSALMQKSLEKVGALINGPQGVERLSKTTHVSFDAKHLFPEGTIVLHGIKMFEKERIDLAILYRASVLIKECEVLRPVFMEVIAGRTNILPEVQSCEYIECQGYVAWVNNMRVILGNRNLMANYDIDLPPVETEAAHTQMGRKTMYLAVGGKLFGMFVLSYSADKSVAENLDKLVQKGVSIILTSNDFNIDSRLVEKVYGIREDYINVLNRKETALMKGFTEYAPESEAALAHLDSLPSLVAGFYRAESTKSSESACNLIQIIAVLLCAVLSVLFTFNTTLPTLSVLSVALIGFAFMGITMLAAFIKRYQ